MSTQPPKLVNKQFNSPIGLYSEQNIKEVMQREEQILANGAVGINFYNPQTGKPANLQNSAVLRMLEEEEQRRKGGHAGVSHIPQQLQDVSWPPSDYEHKNLLRSSFKDVVTPGVKRVAWPPPQEGVLDPAEVVEHSPVQAQGGPQYSKQNNYSNNAPYQQGSPNQQSSSNRPLNPLNVSGGSYGSPLSSPSLNQVTPQNFRTGTPTKGWAPVQSPVSTPTAGAQKYFGPAGTVQPSQAAQGYQQQQPYQVPNQSQSHQQPFQQQQQQQQQQSTPSAQQNYSQSFAPSVPVQSHQQAAAHSQVAAAKPQTKPFEPPPSTITLRAAAPVSQASAPVYSAQPATASLKVVVGGKHLRGDLKWPPDNVRERMAEENQLRIELAKGPAFRPTRKEKDYTYFFAQHALNSTYPGYKIPPGTQFYRPE